MHTAETKQAGPLLQTIVISVLLAGTLDLLSAYADFYHSSGKNPFGIVSKYIASGWLGKSAMTGGTGTIWLGIISHYLVVACFTVFFFWLFPRMPFWSSNRLLAGIVYGLFMWSIMTFVVLPLSNVPGRQPFQWDRALKAVVILNVMIGWPLAFMAAHYYKKYPLIKAL